MEGFWPYTAAPLLNALALALALCFRRNRAVLVLAVLSLAAFALAVRTPADLHDARGADAVRMFAPWLLLAAAAMPERSLLSVRNLLMILLVALAVWMTVSAPANYWSRLAVLLPFGVLPWSAGVIASGLTLIAAGVCGLRWVLRGAPIEGGLALVLALGGVALMPFVRADA
ncbi:MAG TPA: hypothetical protein VF132_12820, partial [Rudaea sp.]